jgi:hypothetical protein
MAYVKQEWKNLPNQTTPVNATRMDHIEQGIYDNSVAISNIIESGSNSKGSYVKYSDGTMIVARETYETTINVNVSWGNIFVGGDYTEWEFPVPFINVPDLVLFDVNSTTTNGCFKTSYEPTKITKNSIQNVYVGRGTSASDVAFKIHILAIGRWK